LRFGVMADAKEQISTITSKEGWGKKGKDLKLRRVCQIVPLEKGEEGGGHDRPDRILEPDCPIFASVTQNHMNQRSQKRRWGKLE